MTRCITTLALTLALLTTVRPEQASAAQANALPQIALSVSIEDEGGSSDLYAPEADGSDRTVSAIAIPNLIEAIIVIVDTEGPDTACDMLVDAGIPELMAQDMVLEAIAIYGVRRYLSTAEGGLDEISGIVIR